MNEFLWPVVWIVLIRETQSTQRKTIPVPLFLPQIPNEKPWD
jgi:hypothetical protein